ncbi:IclR family transcriptional regulator C-terminal domain-containing protein [Limosilactobacillus balticus]|uniref:IclR family transcriptional regulator domain-containing protein n=1 Tax=Limosilactobacillus balticus TaxID=2759747 RepID=UPI0039C0E9F1
MTFEKLTPNTIDNEQALLTVLNETRAQGDVENQPGVYCLGFALVKNGHTFGAFSISTPEYWMNPQKKEHG